MFYYVYLIRSINNPIIKYVGCTINLQQRLGVHNSGGSIHTSDFRPWELIACMSFKNKQKAYAFEKYLKSHAGRAFAEKRFW